MENIFDTASQALSKAWVIIDSKVDNYQALTAGIIEGAKAFILDPHRDGIEQITALLKTAPRRPQSLHIVAHGAPGILYLGEGELSLGSLESYRTQLATWQVQELLLYGCNLAAGDAGEEFLHKLQHYTQANLAASTYKVGSAALEGRWHLNVQLGAVKSAIAFEVATQAQYPAVFAISLTQTNDADTLLTTLLGTTAGLSNIQATVTGAPEAFGTFTNAPFDFTSGVVLSTGVVNDLAGPNEAGDTGSVVSGDRSGITLDIDFDVDPNLVDASVFFSFVFGSEEFPEFAGQAFNDAFELQLNGVNLAFLNDGQPVTINNLAPNGEVGPFNPDYIENTGADVELDAYTTDLSFEGDLNIGETNTITISIRDVGDSDYDSAVFIQGGSLGTVAPDDAEPPVIQNAVIDFTTVILTYNEPLDPGSVPDVTAFGVEVNGVAATVNSVAIDEFTVRLVIATAVDVTDAVTVTYTVPATNPIQDISGNGASALTAETVTNNSALPSFQGASIDGRQLILTYSEILDADSISDSSAFTVEANGAAVTIDTFEVKGKTITLTLGTVVQGTDTVTVAYTAGGGNTIRDLAGNPAETLTASVVTNVSVPPQLQEATVDGQFLELIYGETLDNTATPEVIDFTVTLGGGTPVAVNSVATEEDTVRLTLERTVSTTETVTVTYTATSGTLLQDEVGNSATTFSGQTVTNISAPPVLQSAIFNGTNLVLGYNEALDVGSEPDVGTFTVTVNGTPVTIDALAVDGSNLTLTLTTAVEIADVITVTYVVPATNPLQDEAGNDAPAFTEQSVTISLPDTTPPVLQSAAVAQDFLVLTYDETLDNLAPPTDSFTVLVNGTPIDVTEVDTAAETVRLRLAAPVDIEDAVVISYDNSARGRIQDLEGNDADSFTEESVGVFASLDPAKLVFQFTQFVEFEAIDEGIAYRGNEVAFDEQIYLQTHPDVAEAVVTGAFASGFEHYSRFGAGEMRVTLPLDLEFGDLQLAKLFDETYYRSQNPDVDAAVSSGEFVYGFEHFVKFGIAEGRDPSYYYDEDFYLASNPDVVAAIGSGAFSSGLQHYLLHGHRNGENRTPSELFPANDYLTNNPDVFAAVERGEFASGFSHYIEFGAAEGRLNTLLFEEDYYLERYGDVATSVAAGEFQSGFEHFVRFGQGEARDPSPLFSESGYLDSQPDVAASVDGGSLSSGMEHYFRFGRAEGRAAIAV